MRVAYLNRPTRSSSGFTLLELIAAIVVMSIVSVVVFPVIAAASDSYTIARSARNSTEKTGYALDRVVRIIRSAPMGPGDSGVGILDATTDSLEFDDGTGFQLQGSTLEMLVQGESPTPLSFDVDSLVIEYIADDGISNTIASPTETHRIAVQIESNGVTMSVLVHPRVWIGQVSP
jgi:prepilin-type N-terminal cleavage/methylation domain-containing protein